MHYDHSRLELGGHKLLSKVQSKTSAKRGITGQEKHGGAGAGAVAAGHTQAGVPKVAAAQAGEPGNWPQQLRHSATHANDITRTEYSHVYRGVGGAPMRRHRRGEGLGAAGPPHLETGPRGAIELLQVG